MSGCKSHHKKTKTLIPVGGRKNRMDRLWSSHYWLTREVIVDAVAAAASENNCLTVNLDQLYNNQDELGANFARIVHCPKAGVKLAAALREHIRIAVLIVEAAIAGQPIDALYKLWQVNAEVIAGIYTKYGCTVNFRRMSELMQEHLKTTLNEAVAIIERDCALSASTGNIALKHIYMMSDYLMTHL
jgi:hypothetical protein